MQIFLKVLKLIWIDISKLLWVVLYFGLAILALNFIFAIIFYTLKYTVPLTGVLLISISCIILVFVVAWICGIINRVIYGD